MSAILETQKKRFAAVGTGGRIRMFIDPIARDFGDASELVGMCDPSATRMTYHQRRLMKDYNYPEVPLYAPADFEKMIEEQKPDTIIVCTVDAFHHEYIVRAVKAGCDVITEKPMTTDEVKCREIMKAIETTGRKVRVTFNYRWSSGVTKVRELLVEDVIGDVKHVHFQYMLNTSHGADYFRRWHSHKDQSGGLLVHKSTHHFDLVNWWIDAVPQEVFAYGDLVFYGKENAIKRGEIERTVYQRYTGNETGDDPFALKLEDDRMKGLYLNAEEESGYIRDKNVFRDGISIEDTMSVLVKYRTGAVLAYSLNAFCPIEGFHVHFTGDKGRLEYSEMHQAHIIKEQADEELGEEQQFEGGHEMKLRVIPLFQGGYDVPIVMHEGGHGGGDPLIQSQMFSSHPEKEVLGRNAGHEQGAASLIIGAAANEAIATGLPVKVDDLVAIRPSAKRLSELI